MAEKGVQVSATIPQEWDEVLEDHRWNVRMKKTELIRQAIGEYFVNHDLLPREQVFPEASPEQA